MHYFGTFSTGLALLAVFALGMIVGSTIVSRKRGTPGSNRTERTDLTHTRLISLDLAKSAEWKTVYYASYYDRIGPHVLGYTEDREVADSWVGKQFMGCKVKISLTEVWVLSDGTLTYNKPLPELSLLTKYGEDD